jgi:hypothetical protein
MQITQASLGQKKRQLKSDPTRFKDVKAWKIAVKFFLNGCPRHEWISRQADKQQWPVMLLNVTPEQVIVADSRQTTFVGPGSVYIRQRKENSTSFDSYRHAICCNVHSQTNKPINYTSVLAFQDWAIHAEQHNKIVTILTAQRQCNNSNLNKALKWKIYKGRRAQGKYNVKKTLYKIMTRFIKQRQ